MNHHRKKRRLTEAYLAAVDRMIRATERATALRGALRRELVRAAPKKEKVSA
jgi:hypothetical protein